MANEQAQASGMAELTLRGVILGALFVRRGIAASIAAHATYNGLLLALLALLAACSWLPC